MNEHFTFHSVLVLGAPSVYNINYNDSFFSSDHLATVMCLTQYSPPTDVEWTRDGVPVEVDGVGYEMTQVMTDRRYYSRYKNTLIIRNVVDLAGEHTYCCNISNSAGSSSECVYTTWTGILLLCLKKKINL